jgi:branched-chain amino acid transport system ATP-binding protein
MLKVSNVNVSYGKLRVLSGVSFMIEEKEIVALVGNNGAGKTTMLNTLTGMMRPTSGTLEFLGKRIDGIPSHQIVKRGISLVPEGGRPFPDMTVQENLEMGAYIYETWKTREETLGQVHQLFPILKKRSRQLARTLSGGERQMLAMGRCLMSKPTLCMFDEPSYGLAPILVGELFKFIEALNQKGITILIVEQNIRHALEIANRAYVLENGRIVLEGEGRDLLQNGHIRKAYLGL